MIVVPLIAATLWSDTVARVPAQRGKGGSFRGAFLLDDRGSITENATIRRLGALRQILATPGDGATAQARPVLNLSLALNYAAGGTAVAGYHWTNFAIPALAVAGLWNVHPLQTESVTYIVQRAEALMGWFYLLTLYCFVRGAELDSACVGAELQTGSLPVPGPSPNQPSTLYHFKLHTCRPLLALGGVAPGRDSRAGDTPSPSRLAQGQNRLGICVILNDTRY